MRSLLFLFVPASVNPAGAGQECAPACIAVQRCEPAAPPHAEPDGWLLLAALVVAAAGRLAVQRRR